MTHLLNHTTAFGTSEASLLNQLITPGVKKNAIAHTIRPNLNGSSHHQTILHPLFRREVAIKPY